MRLQLGYIQSYTQSFLVFPYNKPTSNATQCQDSSDARFPRHFAIRVLYNHFSEAKTIFSLSFLLR